MPGRYIIVAAVQGPYCDFSLRRSFCKLLIIFSCLQENTVVQTCVVACYSLAFAGGFGCYLLSMDHQTFDNLGPIAGNRPQVIASTVKPLQRWHRHIISGFTPSRVKGKQSSRHIRF